MFDLDSGKLMIIAIVALIFIGPKDLPRAIRTVTTWIRAAQRMAREFQSNVDDFVRESELHEMREQARNMAMSVKDQAEKFIDPEGDLQKTFSSDPLAPTPEADPLHSNAIAAHAAAIDAPPETPQPEIIAPEIGTPEIAATEIPPSDLTAAQPKAAPAAAEPSPPKPTT
jgi:sec-independent protein translocase protein TatB